MGKGYGGHSLGENCFLPLALVANICAYKMTTLTVASRLSTMKSKKMQNVIFHHIKSFTLVVFCDILENRAKTLVVIL